MDLAIVAIVAILLGWVASFVTVIVYSALNKNEKGGGEGEGEGEGEGKGKGEYSEPFVIDDDALSGNEEDTEGEGGGAGEGGGGGAGGGAGAGEGGGAGEGEGESDHNFLALINAHHLEDSVPFDINDDAMSGNEEDTEGGGGGGMGCNKICGDPCTEFVTVQFYYYPQNDACDKPVDTFVGRMVYDKDRFEIVSMRKEWPYATWYRGYGPTAAHEILLEDLCRAQNDNCDFPSYDGYTDGIVTMRPNSTAGEYEERAAFVLALGNGEPDPNVLTEFPLVSITLKILDGEQYCDADFFWSLERVCGGDDNVDKCHGSENINISDFTKYLASLSLKRFGGLKTICGLVGPE